MMEYNPLISVIVPVYKVEPYLHRCVDSILNQTYTNLEIILVDDGSPDNCGRICDEYAAKDNRIRVVHQKNGGLSAARNAGLDICTGDYIAFVDSDDYILPEMYETMLKASKEHAVDISVCLWQYEYADGRQTVALSKVKHSLSGKMTSGQFASFLFKGSYENGVAVVVWNKLYKRKVFCNLRFEGKYQEDEVICSQIFCQDFHVWVIPSQLYVYCENASSLTHREFRQDSLRILAVMTDRTKRFSCDPFIVRESKRAYCNLYIEYYFKAMDAGISMPNKRLFYTYIWDLIKGGACNVKFVLCMQLFLISPKIYRILLMR